MLPYSFIGAGTYTNAAAALPTRVPLSDRPDWFFLRDITIGSATAGFGGGTGAPGPVTTYAALPQVSSEWFSSMIPGSFLQTGQAASAAGAAALYPTQGSVNGFTFVNQAFPPTFTKLAFTAINQTTWVVLMANTGNIQVGDYVKLTGLTGMLQAAGIVAQVTAVTVNTSITLGFIASAVTAGASFTAASTGGFVQKFYPNAFYPKKQQVLFITQANQAVVYFAQPNDYTPGEIVDFNIPSTYGMTQLNFRTGMPRGAARVLSVVNTATTSSITIAVNTTGFTAFAYPTSAASVGAASPPFCFPAGSGVVPLNGSPTVPQSPPGTNLQDSFDNKNQYYMYIGSAVVGANLATMQWMAFKADYGNLSNA
jgi:hypothetical protein